MATGTAAMLACVLHAQTDAACKSGAANDSTEIF
jgi:hypothetical protein